VGVIFDKEKRNIGQDLIGWGRQEEENPPEPRRTTTGSGGFEETGGLTRCSKGKEEGYFLMQRMETP
jgi:hypothetical protein